jgi:hypothetical protein
MESILAGGGLGIAAAGMLVVFTGLVLISLFIALLPKAFDGGAALLRRWRARPGPTAAASSAAADREPRLALDPALLAAIGVVLEAERARELSQDRQRITLRADDEQRVWTAIGKMRTLSTRL